MQKIQWLILGISLLIITIITVATILTFSGISTPTVTVKIDVFQLSERNMSINISLLLDNQNSYALVINHMDVELISSQNTQLGKFSFPKKTIPPHESRMIRAVGLFDFKSEALDEFSSHINGDFGVNLFGFISFSLPVNITVITDPMLAVDAIVIPTVSLDVDIVSLNETGVLINGTILVDNLNEFSLHLSDTIIEIKHNETSFYTEIPIEDTVIRPKSPSTVIFSSFIDYVLFNTGKITATLSSDIKINIAGTSITRPFNATTGINVPDISSFILNNNRIVVALSADFDTSITGLSMDVGFRLFNPTKIPLMASDLDIVIYRVDNETRSILARDQLQDCPLPGENETCLTTTFKLPLVSFLPIVGQGIPDWIMLSILGNFTIADSDQQIPIQLNGFINPNFLGIDTKTVNFIP